MIREFQTPDEEMKKIVMKVHSPRELLIENLLVRIHFIIEMI